MARGTVAAVLVAVMVQDASGSKQSSIDEQTALFGRYLEALRRQLGIPGLSAAILKDERVVWERGVGLQDVENHTPATVDTPYRIASLTKTFTSVLLLRCVERGTLDLDEPIRRYTTAIPEPSATVRQVFTHLSAGVPGAAFHYDGDRYGALTAVVESCWGTPFRVVLAREILERLGMQDSVPGQDLEQPDQSVAGFFDAPTIARYQRTLSRIAQPYAADSKGRTAKSSFPPRGINAAAGLVSTARDLAIYDRALTEHVLLRADTQELAWTPARTTLGETVPYGLGWFVQSIDGERVVWHYGLWGGAFSSLLVKVPSRRITLILLANSDGLSAPFPLAAGDIRVSPFAAAFLRIVH
jgi:CubicO group peptidase (beta-lactamase class C family)